MKIYDCFTFNNELDLLELRLKILDSVVDYFVIAEATKTHSGTSKPLFLEENKERFSRWADKIIYIKVDNLPPPRRLYFKRLWKISSVLGLGRWRPEKYQRNQIKKGLKKCKKEDIIIVSDLDEIPNPKKFFELMEFCKKGKVVLFDQKLYYYFLNGFVQEGWEGSRACNYGLFKKLFNSSADRLRRIQNLKLRYRMKFDKKKNYLRKIPQGGWHFSYLGDLNFIAGKISNFCHIENYKKYMENPKELKKLVDSGEDIFGRGKKIRYLSIDSFFPEEIYKNQGKYSKFIKRSDI